MSRQGRGLPAGVMVGAQEREQLALGTDAGEVDSTGGYLGQLQYHDGTSGRCAGPLGAADQVSDACVVCATVRDSSRFVDRDRFQRSTEIRRE